MAAWARILGAVLLPFLLVSCIDLRADLQVARDGSARLKLKYAVSKMAVSLDALSTAIPATQANAAAGSGTLAAPDPGFLPLPLTRQGFDSAVAAAPGSAIVAWTRAETAADLVIESELSFPNLAALVAFLDPAGSRARYDGSGAVKSLSFTLWPGLSGNAALDPDLLRFVRAAFEPYACSLTVSLPVPPAAGGPALPGSSVSGNQARYARSLPELVQSPGPVIWEIRWQ